MTKVSRGLQWGSLLQSYRNRARMTQEELAQACGSVITRDSIGSIENGRIAIIYPAAFNALRKQLGFPGWEMLEAIGYDTDAAPEFVSPKLSKVARELNIEQQEILADIGEKLKQGTAA